MLQQTQNLNLGRLKTVHGIAPLYLQRAIFISSLSFLFFLLMLIGFYVRQNIGYFLLSTAFLIVYLFTMFGWMAARRSVLTVYEEGFTYKKAICRWDEIETMEGRMESRLVGGEKISFEIRKTNGEKIYLTESIENVQGVIELIDAKLAEENEELKTEN